jgi:hypothetical protein
LYAYGRFVQSMKVGQFPRVLAMARAVLRVRRMKPAASTLQLHIAQAWTDLKRGDKQARVVMVRRTQLLVLGSRLGRRATVNGRPLLQSAHLAVKDAMGAPLIVREPIMHLGVFPATEGTLVSLSSYECYIVLRGRLHRIDRATHRWLLDQRRVVSDLQHELRRPRSAARLAAN